MLPFPFHHRASSVVVSSDFRLPKSSGETFFLSWSSP